MTNIYTHIWKNPDGTYEAEMQCATNADDALRHLQEYGYIWEDEHKCTYHCTYVHNIKTNQVISVNMKDDLPGFTDDQLAENNAKFSSTLSVNQLLDRRV